MVEGSSSGEPVSRSSIDHICKDIRRRDNGLNDGYNKMASIFLTSVSTKFFFPSQPFKWNS